MFYDVALYGHFSIDTVVDGFDTYTTIGSMANVWQGFKKVIPGLNVALCPTEIGQALIYVDRANNGRYGKAEMNCQLNRNPSSFDSKVAHILYLNSLSNTDWIPNVRLSSTTIFADVCHGKKLNTELLKFIDVLFIADSELGTVVSIEDLKKNKDLMFVVHSPSKSWDSVGNVYNTTKSDKIQNCDVLGAGDWFAANYIISHLNGESPNKRLEFAHQKTSQLLRER